VSRGVGVAREDVGRCDGIWSGVQVMAVRSIGGICYASVFVWTGFEWHSEEEPIVLD